MTLQRSLVVNLCAHVSSLCLGVFPRGFQTQVYSSPKTVALDLGKNIWYNCPLLQLQPASKGGFPRVTRHTTGRNLARLCHLSEVLDDLNLQHAYRRIFWNDGYGKLHFPMCPHVTQCTLVRYAFLCNNLSLTAVLAMDGSSNR